MNTLHNRNNRVVSPSTSAVPSCLLNLIVKAMVILWISLRCNDGSDRKREYLYARSADSWTGIFSDGRSVPRRTVVWLQDQGFGDEKRARCGYAKFRGRGKAASGPFR